MYRNGDGFSRWQWNTLATICLILIVELAVAVGWLLRSVTGQNWNLTSLIFAFVVVCLMHEPIERWMWGSGRKGRS